MTSYLTFLIFFMLSKIFYCMLCCCFYVNIMFNLCMVHNIRSSIHSDSIVFFWTFFGFNFDFSVLSCLFLLMLWCSLCDTLFLDIGKVFCRLSLMLFFHSSKRVFFFEITLFTPIKHEMFLFHSKFDCVKAVLLLK